MSYLLHRCSLRTSPQHYHFLPPSSSGRPRSGYMQRLGPDHILDPTYYCLLEPSCTYSVGECIRLIAQHVQVRLPAWLGGSLWACSLSRAPCCSAASVPCRVGNQPLRPSLDAGARPTRCNAATQLACLPSALVPACAPRHRHTGASAAPHAPAGDGAGRVPRGGGRVAAELRTGR